MNMISRFPQVVERTHPHDLPRATIDASAELRIGTLWIADIEGRVTVYQEDRAIEIDEVEIIGMRHGGQATGYIGLNSRALVEGWQEHLCACAFYDLLNDPAFVARAEAALADNDRRAA